MPQYRIESSPNNRAGCKDSVCKADGVKIMKGEIRFGTWVEINEHGSWSWKHWGCVSGAQVLNLRELCDKDDGTYDFDMIDGFDELVDGKMQEKIRRCVTQGHIDAEDFKGDPEKNKLGEKGIHLTKAQKAAKEKAAAAAAASESEDEALKKKTGKRGRKNVADDEEDAVPKKAKTSKAAKAKKAADDQEDAVAKKAKTSKSTKAKKAAPARKAAPADCTEDETEDGVKEEEEAAAKKSRKPAAKVTEQTRVKAATKGTTGGKGQKSSRVGVTSSAYENEHVESEPEAGPKGKPKRGARSKEAAKSEKADVQELPAMRRRGRPRKA